MGVAVDAVVADRQGGASVLAPNHDLRVRAVAITQGRVFGLGLTALAVGVAVGPGARRISDGAVTGGSGGRGGRQADDAHRRDYQAQDRGTNGTNGIHGRSLVLTTGPSPTIRRPASLRRRGKGQCLRGRSPLALLSITAVAASPCPQGGFPMPWRRSLLLLSLCVASAPAADWPQWLGPNRDGSSSETVVPWKEPLKVLWHKPVGEGHSSPVVAGGKVFLHTKVKDQDQEEISAYDAKTGELLWHKAYDRAPFQPVRRRAAGDAGRRRRPRLHLRRHRRPGLLERRRRHRTLAHRRPEGAEGQEPLLRRGRLAAGGRRQGVRRRRRRRPGGGRVHHGQGRGRMEETRRPRPAIRRRS